MSRLAKWQAEVFASMGGNAYASEAKRRVTAARSPETEDSPIYQAIHAERRRLKRTQPRVYAAQFKGGNGTAKPGVTSITKPASFKRKEQSLAQRQKAADKEAHGRGKA